MKEIKKDLIFNGETFNMELFHNGIGECQYCFLNFMHQHPRGSKLKKFIKVNLPKEETWEERFDKEFGMIEIGIATQDNQTPIKTFIKQEKNLLLDQAISELEKIKFDPAFNNDLGDAFNDGISQAITKLEELKTKE